ncbi:MAG TPA: hypothetical protein VEK79_06090 [Thermoanaerobaculia bacterium]|nr:hypothetical protein [Thermoanaerobaculia bacterium]
MRIPATLLIAAILLVASAPITRAGWIVETGFSWPAGVRAIGDRTVVYSHETAIELRPDGTFQAALGFSPVTGRIQLERYTAARDGFIATGVSIPTDDEHHPMVLRVNAAGEVQWARAVEASWRTDMNVAVETSDGDIVLATRLNDAMLLVRFSARGELKWSRVVDRTDVDDIKLLVPMPDGGVVAVTGAVSRFGALTRIDSAGRVVWDLVLGTGEAGHGFYDAVELSDGGVIAAGRSRTYSDSNREGWLVRVSPAGKIVWQKNLGGDGEDGLFAIVRTGKDRYAAVGGTSSAGAGTDVWIVRFSADGKIENEIAIGTAEDDGPRDPKRPFASSTDRGDVVFASQGARTRFVVGKVGAPSAACSATRPIRTRERNAMTTAMKVALAEADVAVVVRPVQIVATKSSQTVDRICQWSDTDAKAAPAPLVIPVDAPDEESIFADEAAQLLIDGKFSALDAMATIARNTNAKFDSGRSKLFAFYQALARHSSLVALGDQKHRHLLEEWRATNRTDTSRIALAAQYSSSAERIRGSGFVDTMVDADAESYDQFATRALELLGEAEAEGRCDTACYHLQIRTAKLGGWSGPLKKLLAIDPLYWEAFERAILYLGENWGGAPGAIDAFVQSWSPETTGELTDALYALFHRGWSFGVTYVDRPEPPPPDWARMRKGFADFQRLHPKSRLNAQRFAAAAYRVARDRETARALFETPLLAGKADFNEWENSSEFERAKVWALRKPVEAFITTRSNVPRLVAPVNVSLSDGTTIQAKTFIVATASGPFGITTTRPFDSNNRAVRITYENAGIAAEVSPGAPWAVSFKPPAALTTALHVLNARSTPFVIGDRLFVVACAEDSQPPKCATRLTETRAKSGGTSTTAGLGQPGNSTDLIGAPVLDDDGVVLGVVVAVTPGGEMSIASIDYLLPRKGHGSARKNP